MGNCIGSARGLCPSNKKVSPDEGDQELKAPALVADGRETALASGLCIGPLPLSALLKSGEMHHSLQVQLDTADNFQRVKIVVNKKQLQLLKTSLEDLKLSRVVIQSIRKKERKWRPSLATIPEL